MVPVKFEWNDVGSYSSLDKVFKKDENKSIILTSAKCRTLQSENNIIINKEKNKDIALIGLDNIIVVNTEDNILICSKDKDQEIKKIVGMLNEK